MAEVGNTPTIRQIANNINLYSGREGTKTIVPSSISPVASIYESGVYTWIFNFVSVTVAATKVLFIVPRRQYWTIKLARFQMASGSFTISDIICYPAAAQDYINVYGSSPIDTVDEWTHRDSPASYPVKLIPTNAGQTELIYNEKDIRMMPGSTIAVVADGYTSTGNLYGMMYIQIESY